MNFKIHEYSILTLIKFEQIPQKLQFYTKLERHTNFLFLICVHCTLYTMHLHIVFNSCIMYIYILNILLNLPNLCKRQTFTKNSSKF